MTTTASTIWTKTKDDGTPVEVAFDGEVCTVTVGGKQIAKGVPARPTSDQLRKMRLPEDVTATILPASFRGQDGEAILAAFERIRAERDAAKHAKLPAIDEVRDAYARQAEYNDACEHMMERGVPAKPAVDLAALDAAYPETCLYVRLERTLQVTSNDRKASAYKRALAILESGGSIEDATAATQGWSR